MLRLMSTQRDIVLSSVTKLEANSAFLRRQWMGQLTIGDVADILTRLEQACALFDAIPVSDAVLAIAVELLRQHRLRTMDAIQLASARYWHRPAMRQEILFVAADQRLLSAAAAIGLETWNPMTE